MITRSFLEKYALGFGDLRMSPSNLSTPSMPAPAAAKAPAPPAPKMPAMPPAAPQPPAPASPAINVNRPAPTPQPARGFGSMLGGAMGEGVFADNPQMLGQVYSALGPAVPALAKYTGGLGLYALNDFLTSGGKNLRAFLPGQG